MFQIENQKSKKQKMKTIDLILILLTTSLGHSYKIDKINSSSGLFFNNLGQAKISTKKYTLLTFTNLTLIRDQVDLAQNQYYKSLNLCSKINTIYLNSDCNNQLYLLGLKIDAIENDFAIMSHQIQIHRNKRGLLNAGGNILHWLFGTPDSDDAQYYTDSINSLLYNQKQTSVLMQDQISIISSTIATFNESARKLNSDAHFLNDNLAKFDHFVIKTLDTEERLSFELQVNEHILTLTELTNSIQISLKSYLNSFTLVRHGILDFNMIHPQDLLSELEKIENKLLLPLTPNMENIYTYYQIIKIKALISDHLLIVSLDIPIVNINTFGLFKVYSLPSPHHDDSHLYSYIEPEKTLYTSVFFQNLVLNA